ncbi:MAG: hypothetical protein JXQ72_16750 [Anaerolineae bacterium]|nr:hypothetical protein [Anaerolineae bacterium]
MKRKNSDLPYQPFLYDRSLLSLVFGLGIGVIVTVIVLLSLPDNRLPGWLRQHNDTVPAVMLTPTFVPIQQPTATATSLAVSAPTINMIYHAGIQSNSPVNQLMEHCDYTDNTYMLHVSAVGDNFSSSMAHTGVHSPDGRYVTFEIDSEVYLQRVGEPDLLKLEGNFTEDARYLTWEPGGDRAIFADQLSPTEEALHLFDFRDGLDQASQTVLPISRDAYEQGSWSWVPNQDYLSWQSGSTLEIWSVARREQVYQHRASRIERTAWAYDGSYLALLAIYPNQPQALTLTLIQVNGMHSRSYPVDFGPSSDLIWSPDHRQVALVGQRQVRIDDTNHMQSTLRIYPVSLDQEPIEYHPTGYATGPVAWSTDSQSVLFWQVQDNDYQLRQWTIRDDTARLLNTADDSPSSGPPTLLTSPDAQYIGTGFSLRQPVAHQHIVLFDDSTLILSNQDGSDTLVLAEQVQSIKAQEWSADNGHLAVVWSAQDQPAMLITWTDTEIVQTISLSAINFFQMEWSADGSHLVVEYEESREGLQIMLLIDAQTGQYRQLGEGFESVIWPGFHHPNAYFAFHWRGSAGGFGYDGYSADGYRLFRVTYTNPVPWTIDEVFFSPNGEWAALKTFSPKTDLYIAPTDGSPGATVRADMPGLGDPVWSPDSRLIAFTEWDGKQQTVSIIDSEGATRWKTPFPYEVRDVILTWEPCAGGENTD